MALACPLLPPNVGRATIEPVRQMNGRQVRFVPKPQKSSHSESGIEVSEAPTTSSCSFREVALLFGPPKVLRSFISPLLHKKACLTVSPTSSASPATEPVSLTEVASPNV